MAVTLHNGAVTSGVATAWVAIPEATKYSVQSNGVTGSVQFSNDGVNLMDVPSVSNGGPSVINSVSGSNQSTFVGSSAPAPFAFARFLPSATVGAARITLASFA